MITKMTRRQLLQSTLAFAGVAAGASMVAGCSDDNGTPPTADKGPGPDRGPTPDKGPAPEAGGDATAALTCKDDTITGNHGHTVTVPPADVTAGVEKTYSIRGTAAHDHLITVSAAEFKDLEAKKLITITSTTGSGHTHDVTVRCV